MTMRLIESFTHPELERLIDIYWNGEYGFEGYCRAKVVITDEWLDTIDEADYEQYRGAPDEIVDTESEP